MWRKHVDCSCGSLVDCISGCHSQCTCTVPEASGVACLALTYDAVGRAEYEFLGLSHVASVTQLALLWSSENKGAYAFILLHASKRRHTWYSPDDKLLNSAIFWWLFVVMLGEGGTGLVVHILGCRWINMKLWSKTETVTNSYTSATLSITIPSWTALELSPGVCGISQYSGKAMGFTIWGLNPSRSKRLFFTPEASRTALGPT